MVGIDGRLGGRQDRVDVLDDAVRWQAALAAPQVHRSAGRMETQTDPLRRLHRRGEYVPAVLRKDVVVVGGHRASRQGQPAQPAGRGSADDVGVDPPPDRVERFQPSEQGGVHGEAPGHPLIEMVVGVDQSRSDQAPRTVEVVGSGDSTRRAALADRSDPVAPHGDVTRAVFIAEGVDGRNVGVVDVQRLQFRRRAHPGGLVRSCSSRPMAISPSWPRTSMVSVASSFPDRRFNSSRISPGSRPEARIRNTRSNRFS